MLLADTEMGWIAAASAAVAAIIAALASFKKSRSADHLAEQKADADLDAQKRKDSLSEWQEIARELKGQIRELKEQGERKDALARQFQEVVEALVAEGSDCREVAAEQKIAIHFLYEHLRRIYDVAHAAGAVDLGPMPQIPQMREHAPHSRAAFLVRQVAQSQQLLKESDKVLEAPPTSPVKP